MIPWQEMDAIPEGGGFPLTDYPGKLVFMGSMGETHSCGGWALLERQRLQLLSWSQPPQPISIPSC